MQEILEITKIFVCLFIASILIAQYLLRFLYNYKITDKYVDVRLIGFIPFVRIKLKKIVNAKIIPFKDTYKFNIKEIFTIFRCGNRLWGKEAVLIEKEKGIFKLILITPDKPQEFVKHILDNKSKLYL